MSLLYNIPNVTFFARKLNITQVPKFSATIFFLAFSDLTNLNYYNSQGFTGKQQSLLQVGKWKGISYKDIKQLLESLGEEGTMNHTFIPHIWKQYKQKTCPTTLWFFCSQNTTDIAP